MSYIIFDSTKVKVYEALKEVAADCGKGEEFAEKLWEGVIKYPALYDELIYYFQNGMIKDAVYFNGYSLTDLYVHRIDRYNIANDTGKNTAACNKDAMILETIMDMVLFMDDPEKFGKRLNDGRGMDKM